MRRKTENEEWKRALDEAITETENFHEIVLPTCEGGVYVHKKGYSETAILHFVRHLSQKVFSKYGLRLKMKSRETFSYKTFFKMSSGQRKGRSFMVIGWYPSTDKNELLQKKIKEYLSDKRYTRSYQITSGCLSIGLVFMQLHFVTTKKVGDILMIQVTGLIILSLLRISFDLVHALVVYMSSV